ncbi:glycine cleavage system protein H [bacterium]|nr:glycine cleavage system protein H [bacterium]
MVALFVILFVAVLLAIDLIIQARSRRYPIMGAVPEGGSNVHGKETVRIPKSVFFHPGHTWARLQDGDQLEVGVDDFVQKALGGIDSMQLPMVGEFVRQGDPVITLHHGSRRVSLVAPASGYVRAINRDAVENPSVVAENPYREGWLMMVEPAELAANLSLLRVAESAVSWIKSEIKRFREFLGSSIAQPATVGESMLDGGVPVSGALEHLDEEHLQTFEEQFLR